MSVHIPVLTKEVIKYLNPQPNQNFIDCTFGEGGHAEIILEKIAPEGKLLGIELDSKLYQKLQKKKKAFSDRLILVNDSFANLKKIIQEYNFGHVGSVLFDFGISSWHLEKSKKGFSFKRNEPLDMRYNASNPLTAREIVNQWKESEIRNILEKYGEERFSKRIARKIVKERKKSSIETTYQLVNIIKKAVPARYQHGRLHFATRTFQALRIVVNEELENIKKGLKEGVEILEKEGRIGAISFHSLEDRIVKNFLKEKAKNNLLKILTKKPITPTQEEKKENPRSRSAKFRAGEIIKN